jgi:undecaprenyl-diphosphatase
MAGLAVSGSNPDVSLLYDINDLARSAPSWLLDAVRVAGQYGLLVVMVLLVVGCWRSERRRAACADDAAVSAAAILWAPVAAVLAALVNMPIRDFVRRPRPAEDHDGLRVLIGGQHSPSFVSDHATLAMALAAGLFVVNRKFGLAGILLALLEGFCQLFLGLHYPTDVIGGLALGTAVALLFSPLASAALTPLMRVIGRSPRAGRLIRAGTVPDGVGMRAGHAEGWSRSPGTEAVEAAGRGAGPGSPRRRTGEERDLAA